MRVGETNFVEQIRLVTSKVTKRSWLVDANGNLLTKKFVLKERNQIGQFVHLDTSIGQFVYNLMHYEILYENCDVKPKTKPIITIHQIAEHLYELRSRRGWNREINLYTPYGKLLISNLSFVGELKNDLILVRAENGYGYIDEDANSVISCKYHNASSFNEWGYAVVAVDEKRETVIDKKGNELFTPIECNQMRMLAADRIWVDDNQRQEGIINDKGDIIIPIIYYRVSNVGDFFKVRYGDKYGLFDRNGEKQFDAIYDEIIETPDKFVVKDFARLEVPKTKEVKKNKE